MEHSPQKNLLGRVQEGNNCQCVCVGEGSRERERTGSYPEKNRNDPGMDFLGLYFLLELKIHFQPPEGCPRKQEEQGESPVRMANPFPAFPSPSSGTARS